MDKKDTIIKKDMTKKESLEDKGLLSLDSLAIYLDVSKRTARRILTEENNGFTVRIRSMLFAHKGKLDKWLMDKIIY